MMFSKGAIKRYRVDSGKKLKFSDWNAGEKALFDGSKEESFELMRSLKSELHELQKTLFAQQKHRVLVVIQAMDTGGKDGCIRHVFSNFDPHGFDAVAFKKPTEEEMARDFLWRVHQNVPANGHITVFNRSHYEDIIAVRVKKIFGEEVWKRRYQHVLDFERMLADEGTTIVKIFLNISKEEQRERLQARLDNPAKHWKFHPDDLKDRAQWDEFMDAYGDLISKTSADHAPWYIVPSNRKWYRNLVVARIMIDTLSGLNLKYPKITWDPSKINFTD